jgi:aryl-alcohol dehydrogenase-like predicted oxidoreductase
MQYQNLGKNALKVSKLCLGTMMFGDQTAAPEAEKILASAKAQGINFVDTADVYTKGASEIMLGELLKNQRHDWVLASKMGNKMGEGINQIGYSRTWILQAVEASLKRLQTDYLDIYYLHRDYELENVDLEEAVFTLGDLIRAGKIRAFGLSNFRAWRMALVWQFCERHNVPKPIACQPYYNALNRQPEIEVLPFCAHHGMGLVPYSPIARGVLTGKYAPDAAPEAGSRAARKDARMMQTEYRSESLQIAQHVVAHAKARGITPGQWATAWVLANQTVSSVIAGPRTLAQWQDYAGALSYVWTAQDEALINQYVASGHPSTHNYSDPHYPYTGRRVGV